jgi:hypothetical protein
MYFQKDLVQQNKRQEPGHFITLIFYFNFGTESENAAVGCAGLTL